MSILERLGGHVETYEGDLPELDYHWDAETEILSGGAEIMGGRGLTGSIELEDAKGAVVTLDFASGAMRGIEVVVWPTVRTKDDLKAPTPAHAGRLIVPARLSQPGVAVVEIDVRLFAETRPDESIIHLRVGAGQPVHCVALAQNLLIELDRSEEMAGFWLLGVPAFPKTREVE
jgi:hypothetical protein